MRMIGASMARVSSIGATFAIAILMATASRSHAQAPAPDGAGVRRGSLPRAWQSSGPDCPPEPRFQVQEYNEDLYLLRESGCSNYEKPFLFLLFGADEALLLDTGAGKTDVADVVGGLIDSWRSRHRGKSIALIVAHTHAHGDHIAGDEQLRKLPSTTVIAPNPQAVQAFFGIKNWPADIATHDLGERRIDVIPIPGHEASSIAVYDRETAILFTGDTLYPGRLYVADAQAFAQSVQRLVDFTDGKVIAHVLGNHIEQTRTPYLDYPVGTVYQPDEHVLELGRAQLLELNAALKSMAGSPRRLAFRDFTVWPK